MTFLLLIASILISMPPQTIFNFNQQSDLKNWKVVDDVVMGGRSSGTFGLNTEGHGVFEGAVSLENNGGFSSVRYNFEKISTRGFTQVKLKIKGDGKKYQFRVKASADDYYSYITDFSSSGNWEEIIIPLADLYPSFRGRKLEQANFSNDAIEEIAFLIGNKNEEEFKLLIDRIELL